MLWAAGMESEDRKWLTRSGLESGSHLQAVWKRWFHSGLREPGTARLSCSLCARPWLPSEAAALHLPDPSLLSSEGRVWRREGGEKGRVFPPIFIGAENLFLELLSGYLPMPYWGELSFPPLNQLPAAVTGLR